MCGKFVKVLWVLLLIGAVRAECTPDSIGTTRTLKLAREAAAYGTAQYAALPLAPMEVVLSFDDGPRPESTPQVLDALKAACVRATFFMIGQAIEQHPALARRVRDEGHTIGTHGYAHVNFAEWSAEAQQKDLETLLQIHQQVLGTPPPAFRFPYLVESPYLREALQRRQITVLSMEAGADDWLPDQTPEMLSERLLSRLAPSGRGILLLHDAQDQTAAALPAILAALKSAGYRIVHLEWEA